MWQCEWGRLPSMDAYQYNGIQHKPLRRLQRRFTPSTSSRSSPTGMGYPLGTSMTKLCQTILAINWGYIHIYIYVYIYRVVHAERPVSCFEDLTIGWVVARRENLWVYGCALKKWAPPNFDVSFSFALSDPINIEKRPSLGVWPHDSSPCWDISPWKSPPTGGPGCLCLCPTVLYQMPNPGEQLLWTRPGFRQEKIHWKRGVFICRIMYLLYTYLVHVQIYIYNYIYIYIIYLYIYIHIIYIYHLNMSFHDKSITMILHQGHECLFASPAI